MDTIDAKGLKHFMTVVRTRSIRGAAEHLNVAPSVVSRQIAELEHGLGLPLFERTAKGVLLTEAGELVLEHGKRVIEDHGLLAEQLDGLRGMQRARVRVICGEGLVADFIHHGLKTFLAIYPGIRHTLALGSTEGMVEAITNGDADIAIAYNPLVDIRIRSLAIRRQPLCLVAPPGHALLHRSDLTLADCLAEPTALLSPGHGVRQLVGRVAADSGIALTPALETPSIDALRQFVAAGLGVTFLPRFAVSTEMARGTMAAAELTDSLLAEASAHLIVRAHRRLPASVERLAGCLAQEMAAFKAELDPSRPQLIGAVLPPKQRIVCRRTTTGPGRHPGTCLSKQVLRARSQRAQARPANLSREDADMNEAKQTIVAVVGLGAMGIGMAKTLAFKGFRTLGFDLSPARIDDAAASGIEPVATLADALAGAEFIVFSLPTAKDVAGVVDANIARIGSATGGRVVIVDTSTSEPEVSRALARRFAEAGHGFLDAPVSGGPAGAASGSLAMMIGGDEADFALARPVIEAMASKILHVGPSGAGNVAKLVNNLLVAAHMITTAEGLKLAAVAGVSPDAVLRVLNAASGKSFLSDVHFPTWIMSERFDSGFTMGLMRKDVRLAQAMAAEAGVSLPLTTEAARLWAESAAALGDADDFTRMGAFKDTDATPAAKVTSHG